MSCQCMKKLCKRLVFSTSTTFATDTLVINIPSGNYINREKYCLIIQDPLPATTTIAAPVVITIGTGTTQYPVVNCDGSPTAAAEITDRVRYSLVVQTTTTGGSFRLLGKPCNCKLCGVNTLDSLPVTETP